MGRPRAPGVEDIRYTNPITGGFTSKSGYTNEQGKRTYFKREDKINGGWVTNNDAAHQRNNQKKDLKDLDKNPYCLWLNSNKKINNASKNINSSKNHMTKYKNRHNKQNLEDLNQ